MMRLEDHGPFTYGKPGFENPFFIACSPGVLLSKSHLRDPSQDDDTSGNDTEAEPGSEWEF